MKKCIKIAGGITLCALVAGLFFFNREFGWNLAKEKELSANLQGLPMLRNSAPEKQNTSFTLLQAKDDQGQVYNLNADKDYQSTFQVTEDKYLIINTDNLPKGDIKIRLEKVAATGLSEDNLTAATKIELANAMKEEAETGKTVAKFDPAIRTAKLDRGELNKEDNVVLKNGLQITLNATPEGVYTFPAGLIKNQASQTLIQLVFNTPDKTTLSLFAFVDELSDQLSKAGKSLKDAVSGQKVHPTGAIEKDSVSGQKVHPTGSLEQYVSIRAGSWIGGQLVP